MNRTVPAAPRTIHPTDGRRRLIRGLLALGSALLGIALLGISVTAPPAHARSYSVRSVDIVAQVNADGSMDVIETRTFHFSGLYHFVYWTWPDDSENGSTPQVSSVAVRTGSGTYRPLTAASTGDDGTYDASIDDYGDSRVTAYHTVNSGTVTYRLIYHVKTAVTGALDCEQLYWQFIGNAWGVPAHNVHMLIKQPAGTEKSQVKAWAHGPLNGQVTRAANGDVELDVDKLPANTYVEARILYTTTAPFVLTNIERTTRRDAILAEEARWAKAANEKRTRARLFVGAADSIGGLVSLGAFLFILYLFFTRGREYDAPVALDGKYWRDDPRPDLPPALVGCLWRDGEVTTDDILATILGLVDRGVITPDEVPTTEKSLLGLGKEKKTVRFAVDREKLKTVHAVEQKIVEVLLQAGRGTENTFTLEEIGAYAKAFPEKYRNEIEGWNATVKYTVEQADYIETESSTAKMIAGTGVLFEAVGAGIVFLMGTPWLGIALGVLIVPAVIMTFNMQRRSLEGAELFKRYNGIYHYLKDFSRIDVAPPESIVIWNRYLVLATVFGIADKVAAQLKIALPQLLADPGFSGSSLWFYGSWSQGTLASSFDLALSSAAHIAASQMASAAGGGGGFSMGGGFGGGGGGGGAG